MRRTGVAVLREEPGPVVGTGAGFHADGAGRQPVRAACRVRRAGNQCGLARFVYAVYGKDVLGEIDTNVENRHGLPLRVS